MNLLVKSEKEGRLVILNIRGEKEWGLIFSKLRFISILALYEILKRYSFDLENLYFW